MNKKSLAPIVIIAALTVLGTLFFGHLLNFDTLRDNRNALVEFRNAHFVAAGQIYLALYICVVTFSIPGAAILTLLGGFLFGILWGTMLTVTGATIGATFLFMAARQGIGIQVDRYIEASDTRILRFKSKINDNEISALFIMRLIPIFPFFVANLLPAIIGVSPRNFILTTFFGIIPGTLVFSSIGAGLGQTFDAGQTPDLSIIFQPHILLPLLGLAGLAALPIFLKYTGGRKGTS